MGRADSVFMATKTKKNSTSKKTSKDTASPSRKSSARRARQPTILELIRKDHDEAVSLINALAKVAEKEPSERTLSQIGKLVKAVKLHSKAEEAALYTVLATERKAFRDFQLEGHIEHDLLDSTLDRLAALAPGPDGEFKAALTVCKELIQHHGREEEEKDLFPKLKKAFSRDELVAMGENMKAEKKRLEVEKSPALEATPPMDDGHRRRPASGNRAASSMS